VRNTNDNTHVANSLAELLALERVRNRLVESALRETDHLRGNAYTTLVQDLDRVPGRRIRTCVSLAGRRGKATGLWTDL
jgi:hypothetical protein